MEIEFAFPSMIYLSRKVLNHNLHKKVLKLLPLLLKNLQHIQSKTSKKKLYMGNSTRRNLLESIEYGFIYNRVGFQRIFTAPSKQHVQFIYKIFAGASEFGRTMGGSNFLDSLPINVPKRYRGEIYVLRWETLQNYRGLLSWTDIAEAMKTLIQERNNHRDTCIIIKVSRVTQKVKVYLANGESSLAVFSTDLGHMFGGDVRNDSGILMGGKEPQEPSFAYDIVRIQSSMIFTDIVNYNFVGDTKAPLLRCFPFISKLKSGDIITTGQYMNYKTFSNLQFRRLLKNCFHSIHINLRDTSGEKNHFFLVGVTRLVLMFRKVSDMLLY